MQGQKGMHGPTTRWSQYFSSMWRELSECSHGSPHPQSEKEEDPRSLYEIYQAIATLAIIGVLCSTLTDFADIHAGILPIELALLKATHRALTKMLILPPTHPLHDIVTYTRNNLPRKHVSPLANLLRIFKMNRDKDGDDPPSSPMPS